MKKIFLYGAIMLVLASSLFYFYYKAGRFSNTYSNLREEMELQNEEPERLDSGSWYSDDRKMYPTLEFDADGSIGITNQADTMLHYKYWLDKSTLWLINDQDSIPNRIRTHNNEDLVFENLLDEKGELRYKRTKTFSL